MNAPKPDPPDEDRLIPLPEGTRAVRVQVDLPPGSRARVTLQAQSTEGAALAVEAIEARGRWAAFIARRWQSFSQHLPASLLILSLVVYLAVRLVGLADFPIYFFTDEAAQTVLAADLVRDNYKGYSGELLPTFFPQGGEYKLGASVYLQVLPFLLFGKSLFVTRATAVLASLLAPLAVALILKHVFRSRFPWLAILALSAFPAWFLHSRTAFETALATAFFALFLLFYLLYRLRSPAFLFPALTAAALTCYSYPPAQLVTASAGLFLLFSDLRYHWQQRRVLLGGFFLALLLAAPYARFLFDHPGENLRHLQNLGSYWTGDGTLPAKLGTFAGIYLQGLNPLYWFFNNSVDIARHSMKGYANLGAWSLPFVAAGIWLSLGRIKDPAYRAVLLCALAVPAGAATVGLGITRVLPMVVPAAILAGIGLEVAIQALASPRLPRWLFAALACAGLLLANLLTTADALVHGPTWYSDYTLSGMQYGASQVFGVVKQLLRALPQEKIVLSPTWTNGADVVARFFFPDPLPIELNSIDAYANRFQTFDERNTLFILPFYEYDNLPRAHFSKVEVLNVLPYPDGSPGFYFVRLSYAPDIKKILADELARQREPVTETIDLNGQAVAVLHSQLDIGQLKDIFDEDPTSLIRSAAVNPLLLQFDFPSPRPMQSVVITVGGAATTARATLWAEGLKSPLAWEVRLDDAPNPRDLRIDFGSSFAVTRLKLEVGNSADGPESHVHVWQVEFK